MAIDPICGMTVDEASALRAERDGKTFYFCSDHCRQKLLSTPSAAKHEEPESSRCCSSLSASGAVCRATGPVATAGSHGKRAACPTIHRKDSGEEEPPGKAIYTCPMHPEVQKDLSCECPKCGVAPTPCRTWDNRRDGPAALRGASDRCRWLCPAAPLRPNLYDEL